MRRKGGGEEDQTVALRLDEVAGWINTQMDFRGGGGGSNVYKLKIIFVD